MNRHFYYFFYISKMVESGLTQYDCIVDSIEEGSNVFLHGPGGTGKTFTIAKLVAHFGNSRTLACTALTGVAAANLKVELDKKSHIAARAARPPPAVQTLHSWSGVGSANLSASRLLKKVRRNPLACLRWRETEVLFIDEVSMLGCTLFEKLDYVARGVRRQQSKPFGGLQLVVSGDVLQLPPVRDGWAFTGQAWDDLALTPYIFEEGRRYTNTDYFNLLLRARRGALTHSDIESLNKRIKPFCPTDKSDLEIIPTVLYATNVNTNAHNAEALARLAHPPQTYTSLDSIGAEDSKFVRNQFDQIIPASSTFCIGAQVMLKANLNVDAGLVNGSRGVVTQVLPQGVRVKFLSGDHLLITPHVWTIELPGKKETEIRSKNSRSQIPLILAWSLTIHRSQACTLDYAICDLGNNIFTPGQAYVALSRVRSLDGLYLTKFYPGSVFADKVAILYDKQLKQQEPIEYI